MSERVINIGASKFDYPVTNPAGWDKVSGAEGEVIVGIFDDTTEQYVQIYIRIPSTLDIAGTVTFKIDGFAKTADGNEVRFRISYSARNDGEDWDSAFSNVQSADKVTNAGQGQYDYTSLTATVAALGWAANDLTRLKISRSAIADGTPVSGDYYITHVQIRIPTL